ncbi:MAG: hypothetical protein AAF757_31680 [Cyanobacteria bacterium P01_D01_bin.116]
MAQQYHKLHPNIHVECTRPTPSLKKASRIVKARLCRDCTHIAPQPHPGLPQREFRVV